MAKPPSKPRKRRTQGLASEALAAIRKHLLELEAQRQAAGKQTAKERKTYLRQRDLKKNQAIRLELAQVRALGIYSPKLHRGETRLHLTKSRKAAISRAWRQLEALERGAVFAPYPTRNRQQRRAIQAEIRRQGGRSTKKGVFLPRSDRELIVPRGKLSRDKDTGFWRVTVVKQGITEHRYLAGIEALEAQEQALTKRFDKVKIGSDERIRFAIGGPQGNVSKASFNSVASMLRYAKAYRKDDRGRATFLASLTVFVVGKEKPRSRHYDVPLAWIGKTGKRNDVDAALLGGPFKRAPNRKGKRGRRTRMTGRD